MSEFWNFGIAECKNDGTVRAVNRGKLAKALFTQSQLTHSQLVPHTRIVAARVGGAFEGTIGPDEDAVHATDGVALLFEKVPPVLEFVDRVFGESSRFKNGLVG